MEMVVLAVCEDECDKALFSIAAMAVLSSKLCMKFWRRLQDSIKTGSGKKCCRMLMRCLKG